MKSIKSTVNPKPELNLTPRQKRLVRESFEAVHEYSDSVVVLFYGRLFELAPQTRALFRIEIRAQAGKLMDTLTSLVGALDCFGELRKDLAELGRRHAGYKVEAAHYEVLLTALTWAFGQALGVGFDPETRAAWEQLLRAVSAVMIAGASEVQTMPDSGSDPSEAAALPPGEPMPGT